MALHHLTYETANCARGFHIYVIREELLCEDNLSDKYAVSVLNLSTVTFHAKFPPCVTFL